MKRKLLALISILVLVGMLPGAALASPVASSIQDDPEFVQKEDNRPDPLTTNQLELKQQALDAKLHGKAYGRTHEVARGQYVELAREGQGMVWTVLGEFADLSHNSIAEPDRTVDNTTYWVPDFSKAHFDELIYSQIPGVNSMANFYIEQSSNRYTIAGEPTDWIMVPGGFATYNDDLGGPAVWQFLIDTVNGWYDSQVAAGKTPAEINDYLNQFDIWDRYDYDGDGNFDEPDGYIDTFQSVHAGEGEEAGAPFEAIWSHSWYAYYNLIGIDGPAFNPFGGIQIGESDYWVGKYTIQPENGGVGVFTHEYGHDMGLPDLYDYYGENGTGFWTLMSSGSWIDDGQDTIGNKPSHMGAWEKFQLGWLNYEVARAGQTSAHKLGPMEFNTKQAQGLFVILPPKPVTSHIADPYAGSYFYFSGDANDLNNRMTKAFTLGAGATLTAKVNYGIEEGYDYANVIVSTDGGVTWYTVPTNLSNSSVESNGIEGESNGWIDLTANLPAGNVMVGFQYKTDGGVNWGGFMVDEIIIAGYPTDGAETDAGWTFTGFRLTTGTEEKFYNHYYVAEYRTYKGYDYGLKVGPYYFGYLDNPLLGNWVDHFPYQDGMLVHYWDTSMADNNTGLHPGQGLLLPIDAHYQTLWRTPTARWRNRIQTYDSTFTLDRTDEFTVHNLSVPYTIPSLPAVRMFDDRTLHYDPTNPLGSVIHPNTGTQIRVISISGQGSFMQIEVRPAR